MPAGSSFFRSTIAVCSVAAVLVGCDDELTQPNIQPQLFDENKLVADESGKAAATDGNLKNPWGIAINPANGYLWVANNHTGTSTIYGQDGAIQSLVVNLPSATAATGGKPTGVTYNATNGFNIAGTGPAAFIFADEDGLISAWSQTSGGAKVVANRSANGAVYLGITTIGTSLFTANFAGKTVDMFNADFAFVKSFTDPAIPSDYAPFNVQKIGGSLYVAYAKIDPATGEEAAGEGNGYVSVFGADGTLIKRFASNGALNAPWAIAVAPSTFGTYAGAILIGNFGDGKIIAYNPTTGDFIGKLKNAAGVEIELEGLWGLVVGPNNMLYFAAGIEDEEGGLFGNLGPN